MTEEEKGKSQKRRFFLWFLRWRTCILWVYIASQLHSFETCLKIPCICIDYLNRLKAPSDLPTLAEYGIVQPRPAAELGPPQTSEAKISSSGPLVTTAELQSSFSLLVKLMFRYCCTLIHYVVRLWSQRCYWSRTMLPILDNRLLLNCIMSVRAYIFPNPSLRRGFLVGILEFGSNLLCWGRA